MTALILDEARLFDGAEVRAVDTKGKRRFEGRAVPYDKWAVVNGLFEERIRKGAFAKSLNESASKLPLMLAHQTTDLPLGHLEEWRDDDEGLHGTWRVSDGSHADDAWTSVREGSLSGLSVHFRPLQDDWLPASPPQFDRVTRLQARLMEISLCAIPTWSEARVTATRTAKGERVIKPHSRLWKEWLETVR
jgi:HK97 family phage prohead protease